MTIQELIDWFSTNPYLVLGYFAAMLLLTLIAVSVVSQNNFKQVRYFMSMLIYGVTVPGILAIFLTLYALLFLGNSLLNVSIVIYFVPILTMVLTLVILNKKVAMKDIPGFGKLSALIIMIGIAFIIIFVLQKSYFGVFFNGGFTQLMLVFAILLVVLRFSWARLTK